MKRRTCSTCGGTGKVFDVVSALFTPSNWIPFNYSPMPYKRCSACDGRGHWYEQWRPYSPKWRRRGG